MFHSCENIKRFLCWRCCILSWHWKVHLDLFLCFPPTLFSLFSSFINPEWDFLCQVGAARILHSHPPGRCPGSGVPHPSSNFWCVRYLYSYYHQWAAEGWVRSTLTAFQFYYTQQQTTAVLLLKSLLKWYCWGTVCKVWYWRKKENTFYHFKLLTCTFLEFCKYIYNHEFGINGGVVFGSPLIFYAEILYLNDFIGL